MKNMATCLDRVEHALQGKDSKYQLLEKAQFKLQILFKDASQILKGGTMHGPAIVTHRGCGRKIKELPEH